MTPLEHEVQKRAAFVAALREIADLLEADTSLPVPHTSRLHAGPGLLTYGDDGMLTKSTETERFAAVRRAAIALGVDVTEDKARARRATRLFGPIEYFVFTSADERPVERRPRVVSAYEDRALIGGGR